MNHCNAQEHAQREERNNMIIQERFRSNYYQLPYTHLLRIVLKYMVSKASKNLNDFPAFIKPLMTYIIFQYPWIMSLHVPSQVNFFTKTCITFLTF